MERVYPSRINWQNLPSTATPVNETNLNKLDYAVYQIDGRVVDFDITKADQSDLLQTLKSLTYDPTAGVFVFTYWNGGTFTVDLNIEKIPVSFSMSPQGVITMTTADGTQYTCDVAALIKQYTFNDSTEIDFTTTTDASGNKTVTASLKSGSITGDKLQPNYLADCVSAKNQAQSAATNASNSANDADSSSEDAEAWANGERNGQPVPSTDPTYHNNSKYWSEQAGSARLVSLQDVDINNAQDGEALVYNGASQKWVNGTGMSSKVKTSSDGQFTTVTGGLMQKCEVELELVQDLHGYRKPWIGGSGKNKLPNNATTQTINGITWTVEKDADGNVIGVDANGTATAQSDYYFYGSQTLQPLGQITDGMILSGCPSGGGSNSYYIVAGSLSSRYATDSGYGDTLSNVLQDGIRVICRVANGYTANHVKFRPMIRQSNQSADFEPYSNICAISGHTSVSVGNVGKNKWDEDYTNYDGTVGSNPINYYRYVRLKANTQYTLSSTVPQNNTQGAVLFIASGKTYSATTSANGVWNNNPRTITTDANGYATIVWKTQDGISPSNYPVQLEEGSQATDYEPYNGYTHVINLGGTYYGGTLDAVSGVLTVTHKLVDMGDLTYNYNATENIFGTAIISDMAEPVATKVQLMCSALNALTPKDITGIANADDNSIAFNSFSSKFMRIKCTSYTDGNALKSAMTGQKIAYEIVTPIIIQLDPQTLETLVGQNDVFAPLDGQTVEEVEFREVMAFEDVPKAIPYECVDPILVDWFTIFKIHRYGRVVVLKFDDLDATPVASEDGWAILGRLPERFYHKYPNQMVAENMTFGVINDNSGTLQMKQLIIDQYNGDVKIYFLANEQIKPLGSITYILDHD